LIDGRPAHAFQRLQHERCHGCLASATRIDDRQRLGMAAGLAVPQVLVWAAARQG